MATSEKNDATTAAPLDEAELNAAAGVVFTVADRCWRVLSTPITLAALLIPSPAPCQGDSAALQRQKVEEIVAKQQP